MIKYTDSSVVFEEIPDRVTLAFSISNCQNNCIGCHSAFLRQNIGTIMTKEHLVEKYDKELKLCNCFLLLGEGNDREALFEISDFIKEKYNIETAIYSGRPQVEDEFYKRFDFVKIGPYMADRGPLNKETTNQQLFYHGDDITYKFWKR